MSDLTLALAALRRPRLLVSAARHGLQDYNRSRDLKRVAGMATAAAPLRVVQQLLEKEEQVEQTRLARDGTYSANHHIELLVALMAESQVLAALQRNAEGQNWQPKVV